MPWWVTYKDGYQGCVAFAASEGSPKEVAERERSGEVIDVKPLPYPASPVIYNSSGCPAFCFQPKLCAGKHSCPRNRACDD